jgi:GT2 family glycosyltransferase
MSGRRVLFFPETPAGQAVITSVCAASGCTIATDPLAACDLAIAWDTNTFRAPVPALERLRSQMTVWNCDCVDVGKERVDWVFHQTFGYTSLLDPLVHRGPAVSKSNLNAAHDGVIVDCPIARRDPGRVYQRLIRNDQADGTVEDIRTPVFGGEVPFVYLKYRPIDSRFGQIDTRVTIEEAATAFSVEERSRLAQFARVLGLDYGELDVLRDREDGRLFVVDANPTPFGPPGALTPEARRVAVDRLVAAFERACVRPRAAIHVSVPAGPALSVVVVTRNEGGLLRDTVSQLCSTLPAPNEIVVVDDGSDDGSTDNLTEIDPRVQVIRARALGVARARNLGAMRSGGDAIVFADAHLTIPPDWALPMLSVLRDARVGGAAPAIVNSERPEQRGYGLRFTGFDLDVAWLPRLGDEPYSVPLMPWCFGAMRRDVFEATGGFDAGMIQWGSIDNEMSVRLWSLGYELKIVPTIEVAHVFREERPYPIEWMPVLHNALRLALVHFEPERIAGVVRALREHPAFPAAVAQAVVGDVSARRRDVALCRVRDSEWLFRDFGEV